MLLLFISKKIRTTHQHSRLNTSEKVSLASSGQKRGTSNSPVDCNLSDMQICAHQYSTSPFHLHKFKASGTLYVDSHVHSALTELNYIDTVKVDMK